MFENKNLKNLEKKLQRSSAQNKSRQTMFADNAENSPAYISSPQEEDFNNSITGINTLIKLAKERNETLNTLLTSTDNIYAFLSDNTNNASGKFELNEESKPNVEKQLFSKNGKFQFIHMSEELLMRSSAKMVLTKYSNRKDQEMALLSGMYDIQRLSYINSTSSTNANKRAILSDIDEDFGNKSDISLFQSISEDVLNPIFAMNIVGMVEKTKRKLKSALGMIDERSSDEILAASDITLRTGEEKMYNFMGDIYPDLVSSQIRVAYEQLDTLVNIYDVNSLLTEALTGNKHQYKEHFADEKQVTRYDAIGNRLVSQDEFESIQAELRNKLEMAVANENSFLGLVPLKKLGREKKMEDSTNRALASIQNLAGVQEQEFQKAKRQQRLEGELSESRSNIAQTGAGFAAALGFGPLGLAGAGAAAILSNIYNATSTRQSYSSANDNIDVEDMVETDVGIGRGTLDIANIDGQGGDRGRVGTVIEGGGKISQVLLPSIANPNYSARIPNRNILQIEGNALAYLLVKGQNQTKTIDLENKSILTEIGSDIRHAANATVGTLKLMLNAINSLPTEIKNLPIDVKVTNGDSRIFAAKGATNLPMISGTRVIVGESGVEELVINPNKTIDIISNPELTEMYGESGVGTSLIETIGSTSLSGLGTGGFNDVLEGEYEVIDNENSQDNENRQLINLFGDQRVWLQEHTKANIKIFEEIKDQFKNTTFHNFGDLKDQFKNTTFHNFGDLINNSDTEEPVDKSDFSNVFKSEDKFQDDQSLVKQWEKLRFDYAFPSAEEDDLTGLNMSRRENEDQREEDLQDEEDREIQEEQSGFLRSMSEGLSKFLNKQRNEDGSSIASTLSSMGKMLGIVGVGALGLGTLALGAMNFDKISEDIKDEMMDFLGNTSLIGIGVGATAGFIMGGGIPGLLVGALLGGAVGSVVNLLIDDFNKSREEGNGLIYSLFGTIFGSTDNIFADVGKYAVMGAGIGFMMGGPLPALAGGFIGGSVGYIVHEIGESAKESQVNEGGSLFGNVLAEIFSNSAITSITGAAIGYKLGAPSGPLGMLGGAIAGAGIGILVSDIIQNAKDSVSIEGGSMFGNIVEELFTSTSGLTMTGMAAGAAIGLMGGPFGVIAGAIGGAAIGALIDMLTETVLDNGISGIYDSMGKFSLDSVDGLFGKDSVSYMLAKEGYENTGLIGSVAGALLGMPLSIIGKVFGMLFDGAKYVTSWLYQKIEKYAKSMGGAVYEVLFGNSDIANEGDTDLANKRRRAALEQQVEKGSTIQEARDYVEEYADIIDNSPNANVNEDKVKFDRFDAAKKRYEMLFPDRDVNEFLDNNLEDIYSGEHKFTKSVVDEYSSDLSKSGIGPFDSEKYFNNKQKMEKLLADEGKSAEEIKQYLETHKDSLSTMDLSEPSIDLENYDQQWLLSKIMFGDNIRKRAKEREEKGIETKFSNIDGVKYAETYENERLSTRRNLETGITDFHTIDGMIKKYDTNNVEIKGLRELTDEKEKMIDKTAASVVGMVSMIATGDISKLENENYAKLMANVANEYSEEVQVQYSNTLDELYGRIENNQEVILTKYEDRISEILMHGKLGSIASMAPINNTGGAKYHNISNKARAIKNRVENVDVSKKYDDAKESMSGMWSNVKGWFNSDDKEQSVKEAVKYSSGKASEVVKEYSGKASKVAEKYGGKAAEAVKYSSGKASEVVKEYSGKAAAIVGKNGKISYGGKNGVALPADIDAMIDEVAAKHGVDAQMLKTFAYIESSGNADANKGKSASAKGLMQFMPYMGRKMGLITEDGDDRYDPRKSTEAVIKHQNMEVNDYLKNHAQDMGGVTVGNQYLFHQQGQPGFKKMMEKYRDGSAPTAKMREIMDANGGRGKSVKEFVDDWNKSVNSKYADIKRHDDSLKLSKNTKEETAPGNYSTPSIDTGEDQEIIPSNVKLAAQQEQNEIQRQQAKEHTSAVVSSIKAATSQADHSEDTMSKSENMVSTNVQTQTPKIQPVPVPTQQPTPKQSTTGDAVDNKETKISANDEVVASLFNHTNSSLKKEIQNFAVDDSDVFA